MEKWNNIVYTQHSMRTIAFTHRRAVEKLYGNKNKLIAYIMGRFQRPPYKMKWQHIPHKLTHARANRRHFQRHLRPPPNRTAALRWQSTSRLILYKWFMFANSFSIPNGWQFIRWWWLLMRFCLHVACPFGVCLCTRRPQCILHILSGRMFIGNARQQQCASMLRFS